MAASLSQHSPHHHYQQEQQQQQQSLGQLFTTTPPPPLPPPTLTSIPTPPPLSPASYRANFPSASSNRSSPAPPFSQPRASTSSNPHSTAGYRHHQLSASTASASSISYWARKEKGSILAFAVSAFSKSADPVYSPSRFSHLPTASASACGLSAVPTSDSHGTDRPRTGLPHPPGVSPFSQHSASSSTSTLITNFDQRQTSQTSLVVQDLPSQPYSKTDPNQPPPKLLPHVQNKMHQTSSRLLRMTEDDRPFTRDFKDLFSTLIVSLLPLGSHRVRLTRMEHTFLSEDAINNLGSLKFSQSNRMPDPKDPSRIVTTTTTTTFSMAKDMARSICQRFLESRFIESADGKYQQAYSMKGTVWQLTPKGICVLDRFCARNGIQQKQVSELVGTNVSQLVILERDSQTDKIVTDRSTIEVIFRRFIGTNGLNVKSNVNSADSDSLSDYRDGLTGVKIASERKVGGKTYKDTFTGKAATDWLMDCCTIVDRREPIDIATLFVQFDLVESVQQDRAHMASNPSTSAFQPTKNAIYQLTTKGKDIINGSGPRGRSSESDVTVSARGAIARDSNTQRLDKILNDAALRLLFRENLRETHCEENLSFYLDVDEFVRNCKAAIRSAQKQPSSTSLDAIKEIMAQAYGIYNAFLAPGSPCELNIDHQLRNNLATRMTKAVGQDVAMIDTLTEVTSLFEDAQNAVFKLMASDSVPKFLRNPKYEQTLKGHDFEARGPERSQSRSKAK
ncbi:Developmental regulator flbA [Zalerion maritima]|uniref:Developmental regulator flbA n=1 Tax=Zalerion maritima TaxID=339359 RepID=A0AAD5WTZ8_9PEZI|nr:Developmental regulator flbA [Zalerion maritima]